MPNLRIIYDNAGDRAALSSSSHAGALGPANLQTERKSELLRSIGTSLTITATWVNEEAVGCVALPFCNLSSTATIRVRGYEFVTDAAPIIDVSGLACAYAPLGLFDWGLSPLGANAFAYGGAAYGCIWFARDMVRKLVVDLVDINNAAGYIECSRLVTGNYWTPAYNADYGASATQGDTTTQYRKASGEQGINRGTRFNKVTAQLSALTPMDRAEFWLLMRRNGLSVPMFISLFPESADPTLEQAHQIYGRMSTLAALTIPNFERYASSVDIEEI